VVHGTFELMNVDLSASVGVNHGPDLVNHLINVVDVLRGAVSLDADLSFGLGDLAVSGGVTLFHDLGGGWWALLKLGESLVGSHGLGKLVLIDLSVTVLVNVIKASVNHVVGLLVLLWVGDVSVNAGVGLINVDSTGSVGVTGIDDVSWGGSTLGEGWGSVSHGGSELVLINLSASIGVNHWPDLVDHMVGLLLMLLGNVLVDAIMDLLLGELSVSVGIASLNDVSS